MISHFIIKYRPVKLKQCASADRLLPKFKYREILSQRMHFSNFKSPKRSIISIDQIQTNQYNRIKS